MFCNFIEITLQHGCSLVKWLHNFRTPFLKNNSGWLLSVWEDFVCIFSPNTGKHGSEITPYLDASRIACDTKLSPSFLKLSLGGYKKL